MLVTLFNIRIMIECLSFLTQILPAYVACVILMFLNLTVIGDNIPGFFAWCARALIWENILKTKTALVRFSFVLLLPQRSSSTRLHKHIAFSFPRAFSSLKGSSSTKVVVVDIWCG